MSDRTIATSNAPKAVGPYSQAVAAGHLLFCSGQIGLDPATGQMVEGGVVEQAHRVMKNVEAVLSAAGLGMRDIIKSTIFLKRISDFAQVNEVYASYLDTPYPARSTVEVAALPKEALVEIECIALLDH